MEEVLSGLVLFLLVQFAIGLIWRLTIGPSGPTKAELVVEKDRVAMRYSDGTEDSLLWRDLTQVTIMTTDEGPWGHDFYFLLEDKNENGCCVPLGYALKTELHDRIVNLPGFNHELMLEASGSTEWAHFPCWSKT